MPAERVDQAVQGLVWNRFLLVASPCQDHCGVTRADRRDTVGTATVSTNRRSRAGNVRFYTLPVNVAVTLILSDAQHAPRSTATRSPVVPMTPVEGDRSIGTQRHAYCPRGAKRSVAPGLACRCWPAGAVLDIAGIHHPALGDVVFQQLGGFQ